MLHESRVKRLNEPNIGNGKSVRYWMQATQRTEYNHTLEYMILKSNRLNKPLPARDRYWEDA